MSITIPGVVQSSGVQFKNTSGTPIASVALTGELAYHSDYLIQIKNLGLVSGSLVVRAIRVNPTGIAPHIIDDVVVNGAVKPNLIPGITITFGTSLAAGDVALISISAPQKPADYGMISRVLHDGVITANLASTFRTFGTRNLSFFAIISAIAGTGSTSSNLYAGQRSLFSDMHLVTATAVIEAFNAASGAQKRGTQGVLNVSQPWMALQLSVGTVTSITFTLWANLFGK